MIKPFLWGAATSSHQVEGNNYFNDWWAWEQAKPERIPSGVACDQYRLFAEDAKLVAELGHNAHRFSLEWSRLEPRENEWNDEAFLHYGEFLKALIKRGIEPVVTLHHFTNPQWFSQRGGWVREDAVFYFSRYVKKVIEAFGDEVRFWVTINEPMVYLYHGYFTGLWPPGHVSFNESIKVFRHMLDAHMQSYRLIHRHYDRHLHRPVWVSVAKHVRDFVPCRPTNLRDHLAAHLRRWFFNEAFLEAAQSGFLFFPGLFCEQLPLSKTLDFIGVNYYTRDVVKAGPLLKGNLFGDIVADKARLPERNSLGWDISPEGFYRVLHQLKRYDLPLMICENGICTDDDTQRSRFIRDHVEVLRQFQFQGGRLWGYFYWSLLDNFEWADGYAPHFGLAEVKPENQQRKVRKSAQVLAESCRKLIHG